MISRFLLTSIFLSISVISFSFAESANNQSNENEGDLYRTAKQFYQINACRKANYYFQEYLKLAEIDEMKRNNILAAIEWCKTYLQQGVIIYRFFGLTEESSGERIEETPEGKQLRKIKPPIDEH